MRDPEGRTWKVKRRWVPRRANEKLWRLLGRARRWMAAWWSDMTEDLRPKDAPGCVGVTLGLLLEGGLIVMAVAAVILLMVLLVFVIFPLLLAILELVLLVVVPLVLAFRVLFRRPWLIEAVADDGQRLTWRVSGWTESGSHRDAVARHLEAGLSPPPALGELSPGDGSANLERGPSGPPERDHELDT